jgi:hypothetical protein
MKETVRIDVKYGRQDMQVAPGESEAVRMWDRPPISGTCGASAARGLRFTLQTIVANLSIDRPTVQMYLKS